MNLLENCGIDNDRRRDRERIELETVQKKMIVR